MEGGGEGEAPWNSFLRVLDLPWNSISLSVSSNDSTPSSAPVVAALILPVSRTWCALEWLVDGASRPCGRLLEDDVRGFGFREDVALVDPVCSRLRLPPWRAAPLSVGLGPTSSTSFAEVARAVDALGGLPSRLDKAFVLLSTTALPGPPPKCSVACFTLRLVSVRFSIGAFLVLESSRRP